MWLLLLLFCYPHEHVADAAGSFVKVIAVAGLIAHVCVYFLHYCIIFLSLQGCLDVSYFLFADISSGGLEFHQFTLCKPKKSTVIFSSFFSVI